MRILITGSRYWSDYDTVKNAIAEFANEGDTIIHGCAPGADTIAGQVAKELGLNVEEHPADWSIGKKAGPMRNQRMVDSGADVCLAFPQGESRGTRGCMLMAERAGIPVFDKSQTT